jgi:DNA ligase-1
MFEVTLAKVWDGEQDPTGWYYSEKLDGVRAYWDGSKLWSRTGNEFFPPKEWLAGFPTTPLDGELYMGRGKFSECSGIVRRLDGGNLWKDIKFKVFDIPNVGGNFKHRYSYYTSLISNINSTNSTNLQPVIQLVCYSKAQLEIALDNIILSGGEGLILRDPDAEYINGRTDKLLKVIKKYRLEAKVVGHTPGKGKYSNVMGALEVELENGNKFSVGTGFSDVERTNPPPIGCYVTIEYKTLSPKKGIPREPAFVGIRYDFDGFNKATLKSKYKF